MTVLPYQPAALPPPDLRELLRYAGVRGEAPELEPLLKDCLLECQETITPRICYAVQEVRRNGESFDLGFTESNAKILQKTLDGCQNVLLFAATLGLDFDRRIARREVTSPTKAVLLSAAGAERIEALCDAFMKELTERGMTLRPRISPGYGDLPLSFQKEIFSALRPERQIGLSLLESMQMSPSKSVTALAGIM